MSRFRSNYQYQMRHWLAEGSYIKSINDRKPENFSDVIDMLDEGSLKKIGGGTEI